MSGMLAAFTRPVKNQNAWRPVFGRLHLINSLVPLFGVSKGSEGGFQLDPLMKFVGSAFTSANAEVRGQAVKVTLLLYSKVRPVLQHTTSCSTCGTCRHTLLHSLVHSLLSHSALTAINRCQLTL